MLEILENGSVRLTNQNKGAKISLMTYDACGRDKYFDKNLMK